MWCSSGHGQLICNTHTLTLKHTHSHTHIHTLTHTHTQTHTHTHSNTHTLTYTLTHSHTYTYTLIHTLTHLHTLKHIHSQTHTHTHTLTHTHSHSQGPQWPQRLARRGPPSWLPQGWVAAPAGSLPPTGPRAGWQLSRRQPCLQRTNRETSDSTQRPEVLVWKVSEARHLGPRGDWAGSDRENHRPGRDLHLGLWPGGGARGPWEWGQPMGCGAPARPSGLRDCRYLFTHSPGRAGGRVACEVTGGKTTSPRDTPSSDMRPHPSSWGGGGGSRTWGIRVFFGEPHETASLVTRQ